MCSGITGRYWWRCREMHLSLNKPNRLTKLSAVVWPLTHINLPLFSNAAIDICECKNPLGFLMFPFIVSPHTHLPATSIYSMGLWLQCEFIYFFFFLPRWLLAHSTLNFSAIMSLTLISGHDGRLRDWNLFWTLLHRVLPSVSCLFGFVTQLEEQTSVWGELCLKHSRCGRHGPKY